MLTPAGRPLVWCVGIERCSVKCTVLGLVYKLGAQRRTSAASSTTQVGALATSHALLAHKVLHWWTALFTPEPRANPRLCNSSARDASNMEEEPHGADMSLLIT
jgi:hypothetical protein